MMSRFPGLRITASCPAVLFVCFPRRARRIGLLQAPEDLQASSSQDRTYALVEAKGGPKLTNGEPFPPGGPKPAVTDPDSPPASDGARAGQSHPAGKTKQALQNYDDTGSH
jgi:hypothetical protein